ncbi:CRISPR-associated protein Cas5 [Clostridium botulinum]|uniref:CRISPR-associated protein Cas5 n=1 Tax=Clostridium botulinum TaxID=1491 RepID=A0A9Q1UXS5_CLOBO|nr:CRISPR-associated protein Cas5 [Clostridium botulinum]KEH96999.1 CRISPR-associated protein Cas5 [Clostridium botulinum D str. 16868]KOA75865.1 CRISPR-associated protein Cas5 [Clostridium botulinum]KOA78216.1 CRISPR-associated protein Cas5 [Clostridium botulinum]KOA82723.1 CRISPR-associated protein Cas5 [Clostridium botulinum]KOA85844.1 CRISPR-associated protein Cas5 [Clostridium botulinum]
MEFKKLVLTSKMAHFKNGINGKNQNTFRVPPISTIVGILKNIYGKDIKDFIFGYTCKYDGIFKDVTTIYKEVNLDISSAKGDRFQHDIAFIEYLVNPIITVYTNLDTPIKINDILNLGKTNCLAKCKFEKENITNKECIGYNQWTPINTGNGKIKRINKETIYNQNKGYYDYYTELFRLNEEFTAKHILEDQEEGIQLWQYRGVGDIECYQENL